MIYKNAKIFTMEGQGIIEDGYLAFENGIITGVGPSPECPDDSEIVPADGKWIYPGFVEAHCHIGLLEDGLNFEGDDLNEDTDPITPQLRAIDSVNPMEGSFREALMGGVTTVMTGPGSSNCIGGSFMVMKTDGICVDDMVIKEPAAIKFAFGENTKSTYNQKNETPVTRMAAAALMREQLYKAKRYMEDSEQAGEDGKPDYDIKCESLIPLLKREIPMKAHAHRADDILTAVRIAKEFNLKLTIDHCTEGHLITDKLKQLGYPCLVGPSLCDRSKPELKNLTFKTPKILSDAGIEVSIITDHPVIPLCYLPLLAALAHREGMDYLKALEAITINPAKALGVDSLVGSLKVGKSADFVVTDGDIFELASKIKEVAVNGKIFVKK